MYWSAAAVFVGRVEAVKREGTNRTLSFAVVESFRGVSSSTLDAALVMPRQEYCQSFGRGSEYLIYAERRPDGMLQVNACGRTRRIEDAGADLEYARAVRQGTASPGYITGGVIVGHRTLSGKAIAAIGSAPMLTVNLQKDGAVVATTKTSGGGFGWYRIDSPGAGTYRVSFGVPDGFYADEPSREITLRDGRACTDVRTTFYADGHLEGRVIDANGRPLAGLTLEIANAAGGAGRRTVTDGQGRYALTRIPDGRYTLSVPAAPLSDTRSRVYFPGVDTVAAAGRITLGEGERKTLADFSIPAHRSYVPLSGVVLDAAGAPAEGARVFLKGVGDNDRIVSEPVIADFMGRFVVAARSGTEYGVFAERARAGGRTAAIDATNTLRVTAADGLAPIRLVLERR